MPIRVSLFQFMTSTHHSHSPQTFTSLLADTPSLHPHVHQSTCCWISILVSMSAPLSEQSSTLSTATLVPRVASIPSRNTVAFYARQPGGEKELSTSAAVLPSSSTGRLSSDLHTHTAAPG